jgi:hypothetical protein
MPPITEKDFQDFDSLTPSEQKAELLNFKDKLKAVAFHGAYANWKKNRPSFLQSMWTGIEKGASLNFSDEIAGLAGAAGYKLAEPAGQDRPFMDIYREAKGERVAHEAQREAAHGGAFFAGELAGGALIPGSGAAKAGWLGAAATGGAAGAVAGLGGSKADLTSGKVKDVVQAYDDVRTGEALGAGFGAASYLGTQKVAKKVGDWASDRAALKAFQAAHPTLADYKEIPKEQAIKIGRRLLDEKVVGPLSSAQNIAEKLEPLRKEAGAEIGGIYDQLDTKLYPDDLPAESVVSDLRDNATAHYSTAADRDMRALLESEADALYARYGSGTNGDALNQFVKDAKASRLAANGDMPKKPKFGFKDLAQEKSANYKKGYETQDFQPTRRAVAYRKLGHDLGEQIQGFANDVDPALAEQLSKANARYSEIAPADDIAMSAAARAQKEKSLGFTDMLALIAGTTAGGPGTGAAAAVANHVVSKRGNAFSAVTLNNLAKYAQAGGVSGMVAKAILKDPEKLGNWLPRLIQAAGREDDFRAAVDELVSNEQTGRIR